MLYLKMKRKDYHNRLPILISVEKDRWRDFQELCDRERKSYSFKLNELMEDELEKNAIGVCNPIKIRYGKEQHKPIQTELIAWFSVVDTTTEQNELNKIKGQALEIARRTDKRSMELKMNEFRH
jgi:hypothetical protein